MQPGKVPALVNIVQPLQVAQGGLYHGSIVVSGNRGDLTDELRDLVLLPQERFGFRKNTLAPAAGAPPEIRFSGGRSAVSANVFKSGMIICIAAPGAGKFHIKPYA